MKEESVSVKQGKKALFYLIVQYQTDKIETERTIQIRLQRLDRRRAVRQRVISAYRHRRGKNASPTAQHIHHEPQRRIKQRRNLPAPEYQQTNRRKPSDTSACRTA